MAVTCRFAQCLVVNCNSRLSASDWLGIASTARHGFTDHDMLDNLRLIHMNGRVYDSGVGEFLSPDPFVPAPAFTQSFHRYSYVFNNPLSFTDPSGFEPHWDEKNPWLFADLLELFGGDPLDQALQRVHGFDHILRNYQTI
jgi:RHS repeat-associated protein